MLETLALSLLVVQQNAALATILDQLLSHARGTQARALPPMNTMNCAHTGRQCQASEASKTSLQVVHEMQ